MKTRYLKLAVDNDWGPIQDWVDLTWNGNVFSVGDLYVNVIDNNVHNFSSMLGKRVVEHNRPTKTYQQQTITYSLT